MNVGDRIKIMSDIKSHANDGSIDLVSNITANPGDTGEIVRITPKKVWIKWDKRCIPGWAKGRLIDGRISKVWKTQLYAEVTPALKRRKVVL